jgi:hypothetical protein
MTEPGLHIDDSTQSFVVLTRPAVPGQVHGTIRHVQSKDQHRFTRLSQAQDFIEQRLQSPIAMHQTAEQPVRSIGWSRKSVLAAASVLIIITAGVTVLASSQLPIQMLLGATVGDGGAIILAFLIGLGLGSLGSYVWLRSGQRSDRNF